jgi:hypothetical protein
MTECMTRMGGWPGMLAGPLLLVLLVLGVDVLTEYLRS